jgi:acyl-CoA synthetase (AMP-forming)/AMP-acid ligase II
LIDAHGLLHPNLAASARGDRQHSKYLPPGYYRAPKLDAEAFDRDGYFLTGDLGTIEADGRIRFRGRLKEMIKTGGVNVALIEVEQVLLQHPDIVQAYLVGVPDRSKSEIVAAAVELRGGAARRVCYIIRLTVKTGAAVYWFIAGCPCTSAAGRIAAGCTRH